MTTDADGVEEFEQVLLSLQSHVKRFISENNFLKIKNKELSQQLVNTRNECVSLKDELESLKSARCKNCIVLKKKVAQQQKEITESKQRILSIANILNMGNFGQATANPETQNALLLMSEMLGVPDEPEIPSGNLLIAPNTVTLEKNNCVTVSPKKEIIIPETEDISPTKWLKCKNVDKRQTQIESKIDAVETNADLMLPENTSYGTPVKDEMKRRTEERSPILEHSAKKRKGLAVRSQNELKNSLFNLSPELSISNSCQSLKSRSVKAENMEQMSPTGSLKRLSPKYSPVKKLSPKKNKRNKWALKPSCSTDDIISVSRNDKKLKQTTLFIKPVEVKRDITKLKSFNGGMHSLSSENVKVKEEAPQSDDEIILSSPGEKKAKQNISALSSCTTAKQKLDMERILQPDSLDMTVFNPMATSTCKMDSSFDRIPGRGERTRSPNYKYQRESIKKKSERMRLDGWECDNCAKYYETACKNMNPAEVKKHMNQCSRHRNKYPVRSNTPPGFWNPEFPPSDDEADQKEKTRSKRKS